MLTIRMTIDDMAMSYSQLSAILLFLFLWACTINFGFMYMIFLAKKRLERTRKEVRPAMFFLLNPKSVPAISIHAVSGEGVKWGNLIA
jgi:hypothetical protein